MIALRTNTESVSKGGTETMLKHRPSLTTRRKDRPMANEPNITPKAIRQLIRFVEVSGKYIWTERSHSPIFNKRFAGKEVFVSSNGLGYMRARILGKRHQAHRVIWAYHYGEWPNNQIDHINGDRSDNRIENLRAVSSAANMKNKKTHKNNASGATGVSLHGRSWQAYINDDGKRVYLGSYEKFEDAVTARKSAEVRYNYHPNHGRAR